MTKQRTRIDPHLVLDLYSKGWTYQRIADRIGCSLAGVGSVLNKYDMVEHRIKVPVGDSLLARLRKFHKIEDLVNVI